MTDAIVVAPLPPTKAGRLIPRYDREADLLAVESQFERDWPYGVNVDGSLVFDIDSDYVLANFDFHVPKELWELSADLAWPAAPVEGNLGFSRDTVAHKSFSAELRARTDRNRKILHIEIGGRQPDTLLALSESCIALLRGDELAGFLLKDFG